ncbi:NAD(P)H-hydrate dehydratase [Flagellimonas allohymeniacidonis]|uniref:Bifunctional NAD(P)H-hydrate repair enzyme n=1 Tax=Flagellimonas allohymeniacidonis TaxID=2517819 RepID=A0A4Q8QD71_9FLAO|nr:NAD(P)H-hydrate dehydratase [Allomuricauda hymeniacidonis]TAI48335.1 NAD(P)H-hydrate dehydratase [Allomuricauda hymeniacidonis]
MKILSSEQIYEADKFTIKKQGITSDALMERAALKIFEWLHGRLQGAQVKIHVFCGIGNNGGDGMVLSRHLFEHGYNFQTYVVDFSEKRSKDFLLNLERLKDRKIWPSFLEAKSQLPQIGMDDIVVDAIFGIGLNRQPDKWVANLIKHINTSPAFVISVDVPSGLPSQKVSWKFTSVIKANHVLSFQVPKLVFLLPETGKYLDTWEILNIDLDSDFISGLESNYFLTQRSNLVSIYKPRTKFSHKGTYGHAVIIGGSHGKIGAVQLAGRACLRSGSGLVSMFVPGCGYNALQSSFPEAMILTDTAMDHITEIEIPFTASAIGIGMGLGTFKKTVVAFGEFLQKAKQPLVIDADGINILAKHQEMLKQLPENSILTPHPKELERLIGSWDDDFDKLDKANAFSMKHGVILVLKGANSLIVDGEKGYFNTSGNPGLATAGSGDVLTGIITGFLSQGYNSLEASIFGVYLHGLAADIKASEIGFEALIASDIIENLGKAFVELLRPKPPQNKKET